MHLNRFEWRCARGFIRHQHRDLIDELLEDLRRSVAGPQQRDLVLHQRMADEREVGVRRAGVHVRQGTNFARMAEYRARSARVVMEITFAGAAREVTGSCHLVHVGDHTHRAGLRACFRAVARSLSRRTANFRSPVEIVGAGPLTRAHRSRRAASVPGAERFRGTDLVHAGNPRSVGVHADGFGAHPGEGRRAPRATGKGRRRAAVRQQDVARAMEQMISMPYGREFEVTPGIRATFVDAGHILGSASVVLDCRESGADASARLFGRHRSVGACRSFAIPRSRAALTR